MSITPVLQPAEAPAPIPALGPDLTLVCLPSLAPEGLDATLSSLYRAFPDLPLLVATPDAVPASTAANVRVITYTPSAPTRGAWIPTAADYLNAWTVARDHKPGAVLLLGPETASVPAETLRRLAAGVLEHHDLVLPRYPVGPHDSLFNSAILYPLTRALFAHHVRFPLPIDAALSSRMAERLATSAQRLTATGQGEALIWPVADASVAGYSVRDVAGEQRTLPAPNAEDINSLLANVTGSLFADIEAKAAFWQRARLVTSTPRMSSYATRTPTHDANPIDLAPMMESFRNAYTNLRELWSLILPPNSLLALKKLSIAPAESFRMPDALWARTIYDFLLAYRLRTINRGHVLGALTPLYLGWVASHLQLVGGDAVLAEQHIEAVAAAFENDKPYLVARWRWPDRFNP
jgi:glucosylglycerate synthase